MGEPSRSYLPDPENRRSDPRRANLNLEPASLGPSGQPADWFGVILDASAHGLQMSFLGDAMPNVSTGDLVDLWLGGTTIPRPATVMWVRSRVDGCQVGLRTKETLPEHLWR